MKPRFLVALCTALLTAGTLIGISGTALAHSMPYEEATLILSMDEQTTLVPCESTIGDAKAAAIRAGLDTDGAEHDSIGGNQRMAGYSCGIYRYSFSCDTDAGDTRPVPDLPITGYRIAGDALHTRAGFAVGTLYTAVTAAYGEASRVEQNEPYILTYCYEFEERGARLLFDVDNDGIIRAILFRSNR